MVDAKGLLNEIGKELQPVPQNSYELNHHFRSAVAV